MFYFETDECKNLFEISLFVNSENILSITKETIEVFSISNHEEVDKMLMSNEVPVIVTKEADVFLLLIYALSHLECFLFPWHMNINAN